MKIIRALFTGGYSGFYFDDQEAVKRGPAANGFVYEGVPLTPEFTAVRQAGETVSVILVLENGAAAFGDCAAVQYSGAGGRDPLFLADNFIPFLEERIRPLLEGLDAESFKKNAEYFDTLEIDGRRLHTALRYGISQALLDASAKSRFLLKADVICGEWGLPVIPERIPLFGQTGDDRYSGADKMILKGADVLPHALINNIDTKLGRDGGKLVEYVKWLAARVESFKERAVLRPVFHLDVYGTIGIIFDHDIPKITGYLETLSAAAGDFDLYIEGPVDVGEKGRQIEALKNIKDMLRSSGVPVKIVADEWCNTYEDIKDFTDAECCDMVQIKTPDLGGINNVVDSVLYCNNSGIESYQGGTCNETDISAGLVSTSPLRQDRTECLLNRGWDLMKVL